MSRTTIDIDEEVLHQLAVIYQTDTKAAAVRAALIDVLQRNRGAGLNEASWLASDPLPDVRNPEIMSNAW
jgi:Arc/MetJ family transcription regulator